jgi:hypothetical protein
MEPIRLQARLAGLGRPLVLPSPARPAARPAPPQVKEAQELKQAAQEVLAQKKDAMELLEAAWAAAGKLQSWVDDRSVPRQLPPGLCRPPGSGAASIKSGRWAT